MNTVRIEILNPKAGRILKELADLKLIAIQDSPKNGLSGVLKKLRSKSDEVLSLEEITKEVELVRTKRNARKAH